MIKPGEIQQIANRLGIRDTQIEKDYVIGWILRGISNNEYLKLHLIFKGGTALRKIYFQEYRLSEDLDFTFWGTDFNIEEIRNHFEELIKWIAKEARITLSIQDEKEHKTGNYNFYLSYSGPLGGAGTRKSVKVDIANDELLCDDPKELQVINEYSDLKENSGILCYTLNEIITEKMRSLMQRTMPRDIYDIWYLFEVEGKDISDYLCNFKKKTEFKKLDPGDFIDCVNGKKEIFQMQWDNHLVNQIKDVPDFEDVWRRLRKHWKKFK
ncbi:MAG: nucleotidyl transferase AbiEii/AbiGii toxin family protein [Ignavibacteriales bacterium]|nr:MAG: nucleotidyl transferase AbiEii/AbiGii toxin family protein [Ignavibacteriales bacterium]